MTHQDTCPVLWHGATDQLGQRTTHSCTLPTDHIRRDVEVIDVDGGIEVLQGHPVPHRCRCNILQPVRDLEPAAAA